MHDNRPSADTEVPAQAAAGAAENQAMQGPDTSLHIGFNDHRGARRHRFMESADIAAAFRESFGPLRWHIRHGYTIDCQFFGIEMDPGIPGLMLGTNWISPAAQGVDKLALLAHALQRRSFLQRLLRQQRPEALFACMGERQKSRHIRLLTMEVASADGLFAADYPIQTGSGQYPRDLMPAMHGRLNEAARA